MRTRTTLVGVAVAALAVSALAIVAFGNSSDTDSDLASNDAGRAVSSSLDGRTVSETSTLGDFDCEAVQRDGISGTVTSADDCVFKGEEQLPHEPAEKSEVVFEKLQESLGVAGEDVQFKSIGAVESSGVTHATFRQYYKGLRVLRSRVSIHVTTEGDKITYLSNSALVNINVPTIDADKSKEEALETAVQSVGGDGETWGDTITELAIYPVGQRTGVLVWRIVIPAKKPIGQWEVIIDASSGIVIESLNSIRTFHTVGTGYVFDPNPIVSSNDDNFADNSDGDYFALNNERRLRTFYDLNEDTRVVATGQDCLGAKPQARQPLSGKWVHIAGGAALECLGDTPYDPPGPDPPTAAKPIYNYSRADNRFEEANAYFHITNTARYLDSLEDGGGAYDFENFRPVVKVWVNDGAICDACYIPPVTELPFAKIDDCGSVGTGYLDSINLSSNAVDRAEDGDVVVHEYGHAVQNAILNRGAMSCSDGDTFLSGQSRAMGEAFGDYLAYTMSYDNGTGPFGRECLGEWYSKATSEDCLRRIDDDKDFPGDLVWQEHSDSVIWARGLWDLSQAIGRAEADPIIVASNFYLEPYSTFSDGLRALIQTAEDQGKNAHIPAIISAFADRGIHPAPTVLEPSSDVTAGVQAGVTWDTRGSSAQTYQVQFTEDTNEIGTWTENMDSGVLHPSHFSHGEPVAIYFDRPAWKTSARWSTSGLFSFRSATQSETNFWAQMGNSRMSQFSVVAFLEARGRVEFDYKVSSEKGTGGKLGDSLFFIACGLTENSPCTQLGAWSGEEEGHFSIADLAQGTWTFYWRYAKDGSVSEGSDGAFVDDIEISGVNAPAWNDLGTTAPGGSMVDWINPVTPGPDYQARVRGIAEATTTPWAYGPGFGVVAP